MSESHRPVRVVLVDDSTFVRRAFERILAAAPEIEVVATGTNGREAVQLVERLRPDVVVMDVAMPEMDGLEALRRIMDEAPTPVLLVSTLTQPGADVTLAALELGAVDFVDKGSVGTVMDIYDLAPVLREKVLALADAAPNLVAGADAALTPAPAEAGGAHTDHAVAHAGEAAYDVVAIGASTGGPRALAEVLPALPGSLSAAVLVAQHMPAGFTATLAQRIDQRAPLAVREAKDGDRAEPGTVLIAPGRAQMTLERDAAGLVVRVSSEPTPALRYQPSVDLLFDSVARVAGARAIGVVLTGMGDDGAEGLRRLKEAGAYTIIESPQTAVIYGMPRAARPWAEQVLPLRRIAPAVAALCARPTSTGRR
jgi:two-component system chemotaxis response regulator CheB